MKQVFQKFCTKSGADRGNTSNFSTSSSDSNQSIVLESDDCISDTFSDEENEMKLLDDEMIHVEDYLLVKFPLKSSIKYYVGKVIQVLNVNEYQIKFLRRKSQGYHFIYPVIDDIATIDRCDIVAKLPVPNSAKTARTSSLLSFNVDISMYNVN